MKIGRRFFTLLGYGLATAVVSYMIWKRRRDKPDDVFDIDDIELFTTLRRVRSCKDNTSYNDVVCRRLRKRLRYPPTPVITPTTPRNHGSPSPAGEPTNDVDNDTLRHYSDTSLSSEDRRSADSSSSRGSLYGESSPARSPSTGPVCHLSGTVLHGAATDDHHRYQDDSSDAGIHIADNTSFHNALQSPIVEEHTDSRVKVRRASLEPATSIVQLYDRVSSISSPDIAANTIYDTYSDIVQPLQPNTGQIIPINVVSK